MPFPSLLQRVREFKGVWLNSNMRTFTEQEDLPTGACPEHSLLQLEGGRTVALIGLLVGGEGNESLYREGAFDGHADEITPVLEALDGVVGRAAGAAASVDCIIPLTHQDLADDVSLVDRGERGGVRTDPSGVPPDDGIPWGSL